MKKMILLNLVVALTTSTFAQAAPVSCLEKLSKIASNRQESVDTAAGATALGTMSIAFLSVATIGWPLAIGVATAGAATTGVMFISYKKADNAESLLIDAARGHGPKLDKLWRKFNRKYPAEAKKITIKMFADSIHKADLDGSACATSKLPKKKNLMQIALSEADDAQEVPSVKESDNRQKSLPQPQDKPVKADTAAPSSSAGEAK